MAPFAPAVDGFTCCEFRNTALRIGGVADGGQKRPFAVFACAVDNVSIGGTVLVSPGNCVLLEAPVAPADSVFTCLRVRYAAFRIGEAANSIR